jgi:hypothetical protein
VTVIQGLAAEEPFTLAETFTKEATFARFRPGSIFPP